MLSNVSLEMLPPVSHGSKSHDQASCPREAKASRTTPLNSHATRTRIIP